MIMAFNQSLGNILEEGLERRFQRHSDLAKYFRTGMEKLGFSFLTANDSFSDTLTTPKYQASIGK